MSQKLSLNVFKWGVQDISEFDESFIKSYDEDNDRGYFLEFDIQYFENLHSLQNDVPLLPEKIKNLG